MALLKRIRCLFEGHNYSENWHYIDTFTKVGRFKWSKNRCTITRCEKCGKWSFRHGYRDEEWTVV